MLLTKILVVPVKLIIYLQTHSLYRYQFCAKSTLNYAEVDECWKIKDVSARYRSIPAPDTLKGALSFPQKSVIHLSRKPCDALPNRSPGVNLSILSTRADNPIASTTRHLNGPGEKHSALSVPNYYCAEYLLSRDWLTNARRYLKLLRRVSFFTTIFS